ncbi:copper resistance protein CopC [Gammaproteobacteria bacterium]|nr:copper resistance protein CopC [Gammaproteobacteria bacterium]
MRINVAKSRLNHMPKISFLLFLMLAGFSGFTARAHTGIATTVPDHDAVIDQAPEILRFVFPAEVTITNARIRPVNEKLIEIGETITLRLPRNRIGQSTAFGQEIELDIPLLEPGIYQVVFQITSIDGHTLADDFVFTISEQ